MEKSVKEKSFAEQMKGKTSLDLANSKIGVEGARAIGEALKTNKTLMSLCLANSEIGVEGAKAVGEALKTNKTLTSLNFGSNNVGAEGAKVIGEALKTNKTLTSLFLTSNSIGVEGAKAIGEALKTNRTLTSLDLANSKIGVEGAKTVGTALKTNKTLTSLNFGSNNVGAEGAKVIGEALKTNKTLMSLNFRGSNIREGARAMGEALKTNRTLTRLDLGKTWIGVEGARAVGEALKTNNTLTSLNLGSNSVGDQGGIAIGEALKTNKTLTGLNLGCSCIGVEGARAIGEALKTNKTLVSLCLANSKIGDEGAEAVGEALKTNKTLESLDLARNGVGIEGAKAVGEALKTNRTLTSLSIAYSKIGDEGAEAIGEALKTNKTLVSLCLANSEIGVEGAKAVGEALKTNKTLVSLDLGSNNVGVEGAKVIGEALKTNKTLTSLDLARNGVGMGGAKAVGEALKINKVLTSISLRGNKIGDQGGIGIGEALKTNKTLMRLDLYGCGSGDEGAKVIGEALKTNKTLTSLRFGGNSVGDQGGIAIGEALKINKTLTILDLAVNEIGDEGAEALGEALETNYTLMCLDLGGNGAGDEEMESFRSVVKRNLDQAQSFYDSVRNNSLNDVETYFARGCPRLYKEQSWFQVAVELESVEFLRRLLAVEGLLPLIHFGKENVSALDYARRNDKFEMVDMMEEAWIEFVDDDEPQEDLSSLLRFLVDFEQSKAEISSIAAVEVVLTDVKRRTSVVSNSKIVQRIEKLEKLLHTSEEGKDWRLRDAVRLKLLEAAHEAETFAAHDIQTVLEDVERLKSCESGQRGNLAEAYEAQKGVDEMKRLCGLLAEERKNEIELLARFCASSSKEDWTNLQKAEKMKATMLKKVRAQAVIVTNLVRSLDRIVGAKRAAVEEEKKELCMDVKVHEGLALAKRFEELHKKMFGTVEAGRRRDECGARLEKARIGLENAKAKSKNMGKTKGVADGKGLCGRCDEAKGSCFCVECAYEFCDKCFEKIHKKGKFSTHQKVGLGVDYAQEVTNARAEYNAALKEVAAIKQMGYPEMKCGAAVDLNMPEVPEISSRELEAFDELGSLQPVGKGGVAQVYKVEVPGMGVVAFKRFNSGVDTKVLKREVSSLWKLLHPNIVELRAVCLEPKFEGIVLEYVEGGTLGEMVRGKPMKAAAAMSVFREVLSAVAYIHSKKCMHLDLKCDNILMDGGGRPKLTDFGTSFEQRATMVAMTSASNLTLAWAAPERFDNDSSKLTTACDVYSCGMVLFEMVTGRVPFDGLGPLQVMKAVGVEKKQPRLEAGVDAKCVKLMKMCWTWEAEKRPSANELLGRLEQKCLSCKSNGGGMSCEGGEKESHFFCHECLKSKMQACLKDQRTLVVEGSLKCGGGQCSGVIPLSCLEQLVMRKVVSGEMMAEWNTARQEKREALMKKVHAEEMARLKEEMTMDEVTRHYHKITQTILNLSCPRCKAAFNDFKGCFALTCGSDDREDFGCGAKFCGWCMEDCGDNAHNHVSKCRFKLSDRNYYGTKEQFEKAQRIRKIRLLRVYLSTIDNGDVKKRVMEEVEKVLDQEDRKELKNER